MDESKIKTEAKEIMDNFMVALNKVEVEDEFELMRRDSFREELKGKSKLDDAFKQSFLSNAPKTKGDAILTNKGAWTE